jgi:putative ABC transport system permease protein
MESSVFCIIRIMRNYWRDAWRHFLRDKSFTALTVFGLALGLAACLFITLFVVDEFSYDRYNANADRIFRIASDLRINGGSTQGVNTPPAMAAGLVRDFPAIEKAVRVRDVRKDVTVHVDGKVFLQPGAFLADSTLFDVFTLPMIDGDPRTALSAPNSVVLSETAARRYFNSTTVVGRTLQLDDDTALSVVTGVIRDLPAASHFHFQLIRRATNKREEWINFYGATYVLVRPGVGTADLHRMLAQTVERYVYPQVRKQLHNTPADLQRNGDHFRYYSMPLTHIHLYSNLSGEFEANGNIRHVVLFMVIAIMILTMAGINFVNLSIARSLRRLRVIGVKKVLGSGRRRLIGQFLVESLLLTGMAMAMALVLLVVLLPLFNAIAGKTFTIAEVLTGWRIPAFLAGTALVGVLAGAYPAVLLSGIEPLTILRGQLTMGTRAGTLRTVLLVFQFTIAMLLIIGTGVIDSQLSYIRHRDLGYDRQQVVTVKNIRGSAAGIFSDEVKRLPGVVGATVSGFVPNQKVALRGFFKDHHASVTSTVLLADWQVDANYLSTLGMTLVAGRNFSSALSTDSEAVLINETAARALGYAAPLGQRLYTFDDTTSGYRIIGVVKDFNTASLHDPVDPVVFRLGGGGNGVSLRLVGANIAATLKSIQQRYEAVAGGQPFVYSFWTMISTGSI